MKTKHPQYKKNMKGLTTVFESISRWHNTREFARGQRKPKVSDVVGEEDNVEELDDELDLMELPHSSEGRCLEDHQSCWVDEISLWVFWMFVQLQTKIGIRTKIVIHLVPKKYQASNSSFEIWLRPQPLLNLLTEPPLSLQWCRPLSTASYMLLLVKDKRSLFLAQLCL